MTKEQEETESSEINEKVDKTTVELQTKATVAIPKKPPKPEDKPFEQFITEELIPGLTTALAKKGFPPIYLILEKIDRPVTGGECWSVIGELTEGRRFWLSFNTDKISSLKTFAIADKGTEPTLLECFLIDEKKTTLALLISRTLQRLNGQKWLGPN